MMIVANLLDLAVYDLHYFRADRFNLSMVCPGAVEDRLGHAAAAVAGAHPQIATPVKKRDELGLVRAPDLGATLAPLGHLSRSTPALHESTPSPLRGRAG